MIFKNQKGCYECDDGECDKDMFSPEHDIRNRVFVKCARNEGIHQLCEYVLNNQLNGIHYGWNRDYDDLENEAAVWKLLREDINQNMNDKLRLRNVIDSDEIIFKGWLFEEHVAK